MAVWLMNILTAAAATDLAVYYLYSPSPSAALDQHVRFFPFNEGTTTINGFEARVYKDGEFLFSEQVDVTIPKMDYREVVLSQAIHLEYGEETTISMRMVVPGDSNPSNDSTWFTFTMPPPMDFPFIWTSENCQKYFHTGDFGSIDWQWDSYYGAYYMANRASNWMGSLSTDVIPFPAGEAMKCSFEFATSGGDVTLYVTKDYGEGNWELDTVFLGHSTQDFSPFSYVSYPQGPAIVTFTASLGDDYFADGSIYLRNICFSFAGTDLATDFILSPVGTALVVPTATVAVQARFRNKGSKPIENPLLCYDAGWGVVRENYTGIIQPGECIDYTFTQTYRVDAVNEQELRVWCEVDGDTDPSNDVLQKTMMYYEAQEFPYETGFDEGNELWSVIDRNGDGQSFEFLPMAGNDMAAVFFNYAANEVNDVLISPAVRIPTGKHRVAFRFACFNGKGDVRLRLLMGNTPVVEEMSELLMDRSLTNQNWFTGYHLLDIPQSGIYYFAFVAEGRKDAVVIDNFVVNDGEDLGLVNMQFDTESGYNLTETTITVEVANYGVSEQKDIELSYTLMDSIYTPLAIVDEILPFALQPGDTVRYTFQTPVDIAQIGMQYNAMVQFLSDGGDEWVNDELWAFPITNYLPRTVPYLCDFSDNDQVAEWVFTTNLPTEYYSGWQIGYTYSAPSPLAVLTHDNWDGITADSWAYSDGILLEAGTYLVSYNHRERDYFGGTEYLQSFTVHMGQHRSAKEMTISVDECHNVDIYKEGEFEHREKVVEIEEDGVYFIGFHNISPGNEGKTYIDDIEVVRKEKSALDTYEKASKARKQIENGQLRILNGRAVYNAQGQRLL